MSERADIRDQLLLLTRRHLDNPSRDLKPVCLILIDQVATYANARHGRLPDPIAPHLAAAMHRAIRADVAGVIAAIEEALVLIDASPAALPPPHLPRSRTPTAPVPAKGERVKSIAQTIDPLLVKLRAKQPRNS